MALTKTQQAELNDILYRLKAAEQMLSNEKIFICKKNVTASKEDTFSNGTDTITPMTKFIGSELNQLPNAIEKLTSFLSIN